MNSVEGKKGFITFIIISVFVLAVVLVADFFVKRYRDNHGKVANIPSSKETPQTADVLGIEIPNENAKGGFAQLIETGIAPLNLSKKNNNDYSGIVVQNEISSTANKEDVLGAKTEQINALRAEEFKEALIFNDLRYDFNKDGKITDADYPLFIEYISNLED